MIDIVNNVKVLQLSTSPLIFSITDDLKANNKLNASFNSSKSKIIILEAELHKVLSEYMRTSDIINEIVTERHHEGLDQYNGMILDIDDGQHQAYVNNYGIVHNYDNIALLDSSCQNLSHIKVKQEDINHLTKGHNMIIGEACGLAGKNIRRENSNEFSWIDIDGIKHIYPESVWNDTSSTCSKMKPITVNNKVYNAFPLGQKMSSTTNCNYGKGVEPVLWNRLYILNQEALDKANLLFHEMNDIKLSNPILISLIDKHLNRIIDLEASLNKDKATILKLQYSTATNNNSVQYHLAYYILAIPALLIISYSIITYATHDTIPSEIIGICITIIICYGILYKIYSETFS